MQKILVAEDDPDILDGLTAVIGMEFPDVKIIVNTTGEEALATIATDSLDAVMTDLRLSYSGDGEEIIRAARGKGIPVIVHSATVRDIPLELRRDCVDVLVKPAEIEKITSAIRRALEGNAI